jgi:hypothetical protein
MMSEGTQSFALLHALVLKRLELVRDTEVTARCDPLGIGRYRFSRIYNGLWSKIKWVRQSRFLYPAKAKEG